VRANTAAYEGVRLYASETVITMEQRMLSVDSTAPLDVQSCRSVKFTAVTGYSSDDSSNLNQVMLTVIHALSLTTSPIPTL
jgi:hypothetical protein